MLFKFTPHDTGTHPSKKRRTKTRKESCPFQLLIARDDQNRWLITPSPNADAREHSHNPDKFGSFAVDRGKITKDRDTWLLRGQDIANFFGAHDRARLGGRTSIEWLTDELRENPYFGSASCTDDDGQIQCLFIAPRSGTSSEEPSGRTAV
ncbi:hypothetical protein E4U50_000736 [Claviceps purpurea]|nr:hypothetical protein E4U50_000736 [Claviceps purpurea]